MSTDVLFNFQVVFVNTTDFLYLVYQQTLQLDEEEYICHVQYLNTISESNYFVHKRESKFVYKSCNLSIKKTVEGGIVQRASAA